MCRARPAWSLPLLRCCGGLLSPCARCLLRRCVAQPGIQQRINLRQRLLQGQKVGSAQAGRVWGLAFPPGAARQPVAAPAALAHRCRRQLTERRQALPSLGGAGDAGGTVPHLPLLDQRAELLHLVPHQVDLAPAVVNAARNIALQQVEDGRQGTLAPLSSGPGTAASGRVPSGQP